MYLIADGGINSIGSNNTLESLMLTKNIDYIDGIKIDVRMTLDNVLVLSEYDNLENNTFSNRKVSELKYNDLRKVKFQNHIQKFYIPTLEEIVSKYPKEKMIILELYDDKEIYYDKLKEVIIKYPHNYYFYSNNENISNYFSQLNEWGIILNNLSYCFDEDLDKIDNVSFIISKYPEKIKEKLFFDK